MYGKLLPLLLDQKSSMPLQEEFLGCLKFTENTFVSVYYCASGTDGNQMLNVVQRGKGKCPLLDLNLYIHTSRKKICQDLHNSGLQRTEIKLLSSNVVDLSL